MPGNMLMKVTRPVRTGEWYSASVNSSIATPDIC
jgi:hypothetical protein